MVVFLQDLLRCCVVVLVDFKKVLRLCWRTRTSEVGFARVENSCGLGVSAVSRRFRIRDSTPISHPCCGFLFLFLAPCPRAPYGRILSLRAEELTVKQKTNHAAPSRAPAACGSSPGKCGNCRRGEWILVAAFAALARLMLSVPFCS